MKPLVQTLKPILWSVPATLLCFGAQAAENGLGFYLLGSKGPMAAILPAPGLYLQNDTYFYRASAGASAPLPLGGVVGFGVDAKAVVDLPTFIWSTPYELLGGRLAFGLTTPFGQQNVDADLVYGPYSGDIDNSVTRIGDPVVTTTIGWNSGDFHWSLNGMVNVPIGDYQKDSLANIAFHRWGGDLSAAGTWFDPARGLDISGVVGFTFNGKNQETDYRTGTEFHVEGAVSQYFSKQFSLGAIGYYYQQISDDSGSGAVLGGYRGRVAALGVTASYNFEFDKTPVQARVKLLRELHTENRVEGTAAFLTLSVPLYVSK
ncbi:transporter [Ochrobactrum teleogrylli]|uniref:Transporter n=1 Tax=Ochrobactrum teleogrylli TaxID=2479765 RepID=A0ABY2Y9C5_9HYPH|nr:transporter [[Ochrobactrum] teleogrylli]TNV18108.1 transporter [[Ochrobactrum] teleogrylli]